MEKKMDENKDQSTPPISEWWKLGDPTANVLKLVNEAVKRIDDVLAEKAIAKEKLDVADEKLRDYQIKTIGETTKSELFHVKEILDLHISYGEKLEKKESERLDAKAAVVESQLTVERERGGTAAQLLAKTVEQNADKLRSELESFKKENNDRLIRIETSVISSSSKSAGVASAGDWAIRIILFLIALIGFGYAIFKP